MNFCTYCGNQLKPHTRFCGKCGQVVKTEPPAPQAAAEQKPICILCGAKIEPGIKYCVVCGNALGTNTQGKQPASQSITAPASVKTGLPVKNQDPIRKKRVKALKISLTLIFMLLVTAAGLYLFRDKWPQESKVETEGPEYSLQPLVSENTTPETKEAPIKAGEELLLSLSDSCSVLITGPEGNGEASFSKSDNTIKTAVAGIETSGYMVSLSVQLQGSMVPPKPVITIPKSQAGFINPATITMARVGDMFDSTGNIIHNQVQFLPVSCDEKGNFTAVDYLFPLSAPSTGSNSQAKANTSRGFMQLFFPAAYAQSSPYNQQMSWVANVKYCIVTFQGHTNWSKKPLLSQMTPDSRKAYFRRPATKAERLERKNPITNIIVFVHGHNEEEKGGYTDDGENGIWGFGYKRDVWNYMYQYYLEEQEKANTANGNRPENCTLFYEFIYPSYRPIFTPVPRNAIGRHVTLGEDLGAALNKELLENNPQVARMVKDNIPFNLFIVGHSMGGLVARAGLRSLDLKLLANFRQLITWGSPHQGSPVTTLRYITAAGFDISIDGLPFYPYGEYPSEIMNSLALDTPGTRDLRWTNGSSGFEKFFDYDKYFRGNSFTDRLKPEVWDLRTGTAFYNENLRIFNESEKFANKYTFLTGNTTKIAEVEKCNFLLTKAYYLLGKASDCAKGSYIIKLLAGDDTFRANDGASPVYGQGGRGLMQKPRAIDMGDMDHEEFYEGKGRETAARTFYVMNENAACNCPVIVDFKFENSIISAKLSWPSDPTPGKQIDKIEVLLVDANTKKVLESSSDFTFDDPKGAFRGKFAPDNFKDNSNLALQLIIKTKAGIFVESEKYPFIAAGKSSNIYGVFEGTYKMQVNDANLLEDFLSGVGNTGDASIDNMDKEIAKSDYENFMDNFKKSNTTQAGTTARFEVGLHSSSPGTYEVGKTNYYVYNKQIRYLPVHLAPLKNKSNTAILETRSDGFTSEVDDDGKIYKVSGYFSGNKLEGDWKVTSKKTGKILWSATFTTNKTLDL